MLVSMRKRQHLAVRN